MDCVRNSTLGHIMYMNLLKCLVWFCEPDQAEHDAIEIEKWADHVEGLHADADIGFSQEFDVSLVYISVLLKKNYLWPSVPFTR